jgi:tRNA threonylcarbamoyladenosine biosynthesis protein TsaB
MATNNSNLNSPLILALETSGRIGSVAIAQGGKLLGEKQFSGPMRHSAEVFPAIVSLLGQFGTRLGPAQRWAGSRSRGKPNQIEHVYISVGPGSFTGLRIAVTIAKTLALANGAKIVAVDTLDCIAANVISFTAEAAENAENQLKPNERLAAVLDAKRGQFFVAVYEKTQGGWEKILPDSLMTAEEFLAQFADNTKPIALIGEGLVYYKDKFNAPAVRVLDEKFWNPSAAKVHRLGWQMAGRGQFVDPIAITPNYLRGPDVKVKQV